MRPRLFAYLAIVLLLAGVTSAAAQTGPVASYGFDETKGLAVTDASGNGNTGTMVGATRTIAGRFGGALVFDGVSNVVTVPDAPGLDLTTGMTLEAWVFPSLNSSKHPVMHKESSGGLAYGLYSAESGSRPSARVNPGTDRVVSGTLPLPLNAWSHLAATYDGATLRIFINGVQVRTTTGAGPILASSGVLTLGGYPARREFFRGRLDEVRIYDRAVTSAEIQADMLTPVSGGTAPPPPPPPPPPVDDITPPVVAMTAPLPNAIVDGMVTVSASASDNVGVEGVQFYLDGELFGPEDTAAPYGVTWDSSAASDGLHTFTAVARDAAGNRAVAAVEVTVAPRDAVAPTVALTAPAAGATLSGNTTITASASDDVAVAGVQFLIDGTPHGAEDTDAPYSVAWDTKSATDAPHTLTAMARDAAGNRTTSIPVLVTVDNRDRVPPTVTLTAPAAGATLSGTVAIESSADDDVDVAGVQFFVDGAPIGAEDTSAPYSVSWDTKSASDAPHTITAVARDAADNRTTSAAVQVTVENRDLVDPTVAITTPGAGATLAGTVTIAASASDNVGVAGVQFLLDGAPLGAEDTSAPYTVSWDTKSATDAPHTLTAVARDAADNRTTSAAVQVTVDNRDKVAPSVSITAPAGGATLSETVAITASASDNIGIAGVQFLLDGAPLGAEDTSAPYTVSWDTKSATDAPHTLTAVARDAAGNRTTSAAVQVTVENRDLVAPTVTMTAPAAGATLSGTVTVAASASDNVGIAGVQFLVDGAPLGAEDTSAPYSVSWDTKGATDAPHTVTALARDAAGNRKTATAVAVTVDNRDLVAPTVAITAPSAGATVSGVITVSASASDNVGVAGVQFFADGTALGPEDTSAPFSTGWDTRTPPNGTHALTAVARDAAGNRTTSAAVSVVISNDVTAPTISISAPAGGASVSGTIAVTATATDNVKVTSVQFFLDGAPLGAEDLLAPFSVSWDTTAAADGSHVLTATAHDAAGNSRTSAAVTVSVSNAAPTGPAKVGSWAGPFDWPIVAVHMTMLHTGEVLIWDDNGGTTSRLWNPATNLFTALPNTSTNLFCASQSALADGRILVPGGHDPAGLGSSDGNVFDPVTRQWTATARMAFRRWYPNSTTLADGRVIAIGGAQTCFTCIAEVPEIYNPATNGWTSMPAARINLPLYPYTYQLPDGRVIVAGANEGIAVTRALDLSTQVWTTIDPVAVDGGSSAMYRLGKIIKSGSWSRNTDIPSVPAAATTYVLDVNAATPRWRQTPSMAFPRAHHNLTMLPDGNVLVTGGERMTDGIDTSEGVLEAELWSPATERWQTLAAMKVPRLYHGSALLLPDGRVLVAGSGRLTGAIDQLSAEIYSPPYLFKGARPTITAAPSRIEYGSAFDVLTPDATSIASVSLIRLGSVTHTFDRDQRFLDLTFRQTPGGLSIDTPANANQAPPGYYMLFILNSSGVPSVASFVRLPSPAEDLQAPTAPSALVAQGGAGTAALTWAASTDNTGVASYNVHRSATSGFTPSVANRIAQVTATSYVDSGRAAGTYFYVVTAQDVVGNVSAPSNEAAATVLSDTIPPTVVITSPAPGATISGSITLSATAADDSGVAGVQFRLDGASVGAEDTAAPFAISWNSNGVPNGTYELTAVARDTSGNATESAPVIVTINNIQGAPAGLVAAYNFDEGLGAIANDRSGNGLVGSISGAAWGAGHTGGALAFDGVNDWVTVNDSPALALTTGMTLEAWVAPSTTTDWRTIMLKERAAGLAWGIYGSNDAGLTAGYVHIGADIVANGNARLPINAWSHVALTFDGATLRLYINGTLNTATSVSGATATSALPLRIGGNSIWGEFFSGRIDDVRIYNRPLSSSEVQSDMATPVP